MSRQSPSANSITSVIGPSHAIRWNWHVRDDVVQASVPFECITGIGGAPIWSKRLFTVAQQAISTKGTLGVIVGDFRFGNAIALNPPDARADLFQDGYLGVTPQAMTPESDAEMLDRGLKAIAVFHQTFGKSVRFVFWDLLGRQVLDRLGGRYIKDGRYQHPVFTYADVVSRLPDAEIVDLSPLLRMPMHEVRRLFIDTSCHPSQIGYLFLNAALCEGRPPVEAYQQAVHHVEEHLISLARKITNGSQAKVVLAGSSVWLDTLMGYMGQSCAERLAAQGLVLAPIDRPPGQPDLHHLLQGTRLETYRRIILSAGGHDLSRDLAQRFGTRPELWQDLPCIDWETAAAPAIRARNETPRYAHASARSPNKASTLLPQLESHMVEQGPLGIPSWTGLLHILNLIASGKLPA